MSVLTTIYWHKPVDLFFFPQRKSFEVIAETKVSKLIPHLILLILKESLSYRSYRALLGDKSSPFQFPQFKNTVHECVNYYCSRE